MTKVSNTSGLRQWLVLGGALLLLDASVTFRNLWPTPAITWAGDLSIELAACLLLLLFLQHRGVRRSRHLPAVLAAVWVVLAIGHYADVTAPALFGRPINLYWDARHLRNVAAMLANPASWLSVILAVAGAVIVPLLLFWPLRWAWRQVAAASEGAAPRRPLAALAIAVVGLFVLQPLTAAVPLWPRFATPVTETYGRQVRLLVSELSTAGSTKVPASPRLVSNLSRLGGADVLLIFVESYGAVAYDRPEFARALAPAQARLEADIRDSGRAVVSAFIESPTFGGSSWLAHISLLSGLEVRDEDTNNVLMTQQRDTLVTAFSRQGYRTVAVMPGLQQQWPEGSFYRFDDIYNEIRLDYRGPQFGWWSVPDQFTLARLDQKEVATAPRKPLFVMYPTISTHTPFSPTAPYQPDWSRMLNDEPYDEPEVARAFDRVPDWLDLGPSYVYALTYDFASLGGYLRLRADRDLVMILIGDHQPPAAVSGEGARWDVPMHVIASRPEVLDRLVESGFSRGLQPHGGALMKMHTLAGVLLQAFGGPEN